MVDQVNLVNLPLTMDVTVQEAKTHLSRLLRKVESGEVVTIRRGRQRIAVLSPAPAEPGSRQIWGEHEGSLADDFDALLDDFAGHQ